MFVLDMFFPYAYKLFKNCRSVERLAKKIERKNLKNEVSLNVMINDKLSRLGPATITTDYSVAINNTQNYEVYLHKKLGTNPWGIVMPNKNRADKAFCNREPRDKLNEIIQELEEHELKIVNSDIPEFLKK